ncbi:hypothetical protein [Phormidesmis priestleyi]
MSAADLMARIDAARGEQQRASDLLAEARERYQPPEPPPEPPDAGIDGSAIGHAVLSIAGFLPVVGAIPDLANVIWYAAEGDEVNAAISATAAIPVFGDAAAAVRLAATGVSAAIDVGDGDELDSEGGVPALQFRDPLPVIGAPVPGLPGSHYGETRDNRGSTAAARTYDARVNGNDTGLAVYLDNPNSGSSDPDNPVPGTRDTEFDWVEYGPNGEITLLDAKHYTTGGIFTAPFGIDDRLEAALEQADRQIAAMEHTGIDPDNIRIEWRVAGLEAAELLQDLLHDDGIDDDVITVKHVR